MTNLFECCLEYIIEDQRTGDEICSTCGRAKQFIDTTVHNFKPMERCSASTYIDTEFELMNVCDGITYLKVLPTQLSHCYETKLQKIIKCQRKQRLFACIMPANKTFLPVL